MGANKEYIEKEIPHLSRLMCESAEELVRQSEVIVVNHRDDEFQAALADLKPGAAIVDLVRIMEPGHLPGREYYGICW
jgi:GDP-mannose 6-dehydrogenase